MARHVVFDCDGTLVDTRVFPYQLFPGIKDLLLDLHHDHFLYVWTARDRRSTRRILEESGVYHLFEKVCTVDDALPKPNIDGIQHLVGEFPKKSCCVIGDTSSDIMGAKNFGVLGLGAVWNIDAKVEILREAGADFIVSHPLECSKLVREILKGEEHV